MSPGPGTLVAFLNRRAPMLLVHPRLALMLTLVCFLGSLSIGRFGGVREPLASRFRTPAPCEQQVAQQQDFGVARRAGSRRRPRC